MNNFMSLISGLLFGIGLSISGMMSPKKVIGFLDITGQWDPSLALVMGGALFISIIAFKFILTKSSPICENQFHVPSNTKLDKAIIIGPIIFGIGWGLIGLCPGPALANLYTLDFATLSFVIAMVTSMVLTDKILSKS